jgi:hypothetical protein
MMQKLLFTLVFIMPASILLGFAILNARWNRVLFLFAGMTLLTTWLVFQDGRESRLPVMPLVAAFQFGLMATAIAVGVVIRTARRVLSRNRGSFDAAPSSADAIRWPDIIFGSALASFIPALFAHQGAFARVDGAVLFIGLGTIIGIAVFASATLLRSKSYAFAATAASCALSLAALATYALNTGANVQYAAKKLAQGKPYCIQSGNTVVVDIWDLTILNLRAKGTSNMYLNYHALLVTGENGMNQFHNWSYHRRQFQPAEMRYKPDRICTPQITP